jgi:hypothetical protein
VGTQQVVPVQIMPSPTQEPAWPGMHWAGPIAQHLLPVQKLSASVLHTSASPVTQVQSSGTRHSLWLGDQYVPGPSLQ